MFATYIMEQYNDVLEEISMFKECVTKIVTNVIVGSVSYILINRIVKHNDDTIKRKKKQHRNITVIYTEFVEPTKES